MAIVPLWTPASLGLSPILMPASSLVKSNVDTSRGTSGLHGPETLFLVPLAYFSSVARFLLAQRFLSFHEAVPFRAYIIITELADAN